MLKACKNIHVKENGRKASCVDFAWLYLFLVLYPSGGNLKIRI